MKNRMCVVKSGNRRGFTLAETMIVILVIGILTVTLTASIRKSRLAGQQKKAEAELQLISAAVEQLAWDTGLLPRALNRVKPGSSECWNLTTADAGLMATDGDFPNWKGPYIRDIPLDPWGSRYFFDPDYRINGAYKMVVGSFGPNKVGRNVYDKDNVYVLVAY